MLENNARKGTTFQYFSIQYANKKWVAWYYDKVTTDTVKELSNGDRS